MYKNLLLYKEFLQQILSPPGPIWILFVGALYYQQLAGLQG